MAKTDLAIYDQKLADYVRMLTLNEIKKHLLLGPKKSPLYQELLIKLAGSILPKKNEITGADGKDLPTPIFNITPYVNQSAAIVTPYRDVIPNNNGN